MMATMTTQQVIDELVQVRIYVDPTRTIFLGRGTAFWASVGGEKKLVTAAHLVWPDLGKPQSSTPNAPRTLTEDSRIATVVWTAKVVTGQAECVITAHTARSTYDYVTIDLRALDPSVDLPGGKVFDLHPATPAVGDKVVAVGFPDSCPTGNSAPGTVVEVPVHTISMMRVAGRAEPGYSGGPAFLALTGGDVDDRVVGLISGATTAAEDDFALFGAASFK